MLSFLAWSSLQWFHWLLVIENQLLHNVLTAVMAVLLGLLIYFLLTLDLPFEGQHSVGPDLLELVYGGDEPPALSRAGWARAAAPGARPRGPRFRDREIPKRPSLSLSGSRFGDWGSGSSQNRRRPRGVRGGR